jgi:hypothetical protein
VYYDVKPCQVCGSEVELTAADPADVPEPDGPVGPREGYVGGGDPTVDERICTNPDCPTNTGSAAQDQAV